MRRSSKYCQVLDLLRYCYVFSQESRRLHTGRAGGLDAALAEAMTATDDVDVSIGPEVSGVTVSFL